MSVLKAVSSLAIVFSLALSASCSFGPPPTCGENIGGTADQELFAKYFSSMTLLDDSTGEAGVPGENGAEFAKGSPLSIRYTAAAATTMRVCIQPMGGQSKLAFNETRDIQAGESKIVLPAFDPGSYVIRVIVDDTLIKNFPFSVK